MAERMSTPFPLQTLLDLSHARLEDATRELGRLVASERESEQKLAILVQYRDEYNARFAEAARAGLSPLTWQNFRAFLDKLDQAIAQQTRAVEASHQRTVDGQKAWLTQRTRSKAMDTLSDRHRQAEVRRDGRREQRLTDEHAAKTRGDPEGE